MQRFSTQFLEDGDFIRLKTCAYLPVPRSGGCQNALAFAHALRSGAEPFTITDYRGFDPEVSTNTSQGPAPDPAGRRFRDPRAEVRRSRWG